jgi:hypothetical protein
VACHLQSAAARGSSPAGYGPRLLPMRGRGAGGLKPSGVDMERLRVVDTGRGKRCAGWEGSEHDGALRRACEGGEDGEEAAAVAQAPSRGHGGARAAAGRAESERDVSGGEGQGARVFYVVLTTRGREVASGVSAKEPRGAREQSRSAIAAASEIQIFNTTSNVQLKLHISCIRNS